MIKNVDAILAHLFGDRLIIVQFWRDGRAAEGAPLLREYGTKVLSRVRIPLSPPVFISRKVFAGISGFIKTPQNPSIHGLWQASIA